MAGKLVELQQAAKLLGITPDQLNEMRSRSEIFGYRDGATWKFKMEELERVADEMGVVLGGAVVSPSEGGSAIDKDLDQLFDVADIEEPEAHDSGDEIESILVSEQELGRSEDTTASTIIGKTKNKTGEESDIRLADDKPATSGSDVELVADLGGGSDLKLVPSGSDVQKKDSDIKKKKKDAGDDWDLDLGLEETISTGPVESKGINLGDELDLGGDELTLADDSSKGKAKKPSGSAIDLDDDDDLVLGSGIGSDVTLSAGDSGIGLKSPADSGLSLEDEPLELGGSQVESLELGEDDMIQLEEEHDPDAATQLKADDDFLLTPLDDEGPDTSDSGSQVIALDTEEFDEAANTMLAMGGQNLLLEEEAGPLGGLQPQLGVPAAGGAAPLASGAPLVLPQYAPEAPYSVWNVISLLFAMILLTFTGMLMVDLVRHVWSWDEPYAINSSIMDKVIEMLGG